MTVVVVGVVVVGREVVTELKVEETVLVVVAFVHLAVEKVEISVDVVTGEVSNVVFKLAVVAVVPIVVLTFVVTNGVIVVVAFVSGKSWVVDVRLKATFVVEEFVKVDVRFTAVAVATMVVKELVTVLVFAEEFEID